MLETGATHVGVATDHVIESFRNDLWPGYKTGEGIEPALWSAVSPARGGARRDGRRRVADGGARGRRRTRVGRAARRRATRPWRKSASGRRTRIWRSASRAIAWCRSTERRRRFATQPACARSSASTPALIPDYLALVGDCRRRLSGHRRHRGRRAARMLNKHGPIEAFPPEVLGERRELALLFKTLATLQDRCAAVRGRRRAAVARRDDGVSCLRRAGRRCPARRARGAGPDEDRRLTPGSDAITAGRSPSRGTSTRSRFPRPHAAIGWLRFPPSS